MKDNTLAKIFAVSAAGVIAVSAALAQTTTTVTTDAGAVTTGLTTRTGSFVTYTPGDEYFTFRTTPAAEPVRYYYTKETTFVDPTGRTVELSAIRPDRCDGLLPTGEFELCARWGGKTASAIMRRKKRRRQQQPRHNVGFGRNNARWFARRAFFML